MKKLILPLVTSTLVAFTAYAGEKFSDGEANFKLTQKRLLEKYIDKNITQDELYRAATAGMLAALNSGEESWNKLLSPREIKAMEEDLSGQVSGIGVAIKFDEHFGTGQILQVIPNTPAAVAGLRPDDQILSVDGKKFKGKPFRELVAAIRGQIGQGVQLKVLRDDKVVSLEVHRKVIPYDPVTLKKIDGVTALMTISYFSKETPKLVEKFTNQLNQENVKKLIVDLRGNSGGGFDQAVAAAEILLPKDALIVSTKNREGASEEFRSTKGLLRPDVRLVMLVNKETSCGGELVAAALRESRNGKMVGETTLGKWNAQVVEKLNNDFAIKYTVREFRSPRGNSYQGKGLKPDLEVAVPKEFDGGEIETKYDIPQRLTLDPQLKAAVELIKST